jgi:hypothetical protein
MRRSSILIEGAIETSPSVSVLSVRARYVSQLAANSAVTIGDSDGV